MLVIDCGVLFPEDDHPGVDLLLPGLDYLDEEKLARVKALVLTHGHEDHIGAVPYLLKRRSDIPIYGSKLTLALVEAKLREHRIKGYKLNVVHEATSLRLASSLTWNLSPLTIPFLTLWQCVCAPMPELSLTPATSRWTSFR